MIEIRDKRRNTNRKYTHEISDISRRDISSVIKEPMTPDLNQRRIDQVKEKRFSKLDDCTRTRSDNKERTSITS